MGGIKKLKKKFSKPGHPWQKTRIEEEKILLEEYGLKNKREIWRMSSKMKTFANQAKKLIAATGKQADVEKQQLISRLNSLGLVTNTADLDDVLSLNLKNFLDRRLQTVLLRKGLARSHKQARQFITHEHVLVGSKKITSPSYLVLTQEESGISFAPASVFTSADHPERTPIQKKPETKKRIVPRKEYHGGRR